MWMNVTSCVRAHFLCVPACLASAVPDFAILVLPGWEDCTVWALSAWLAPIVSTFVLLDQVNGSVCTLPTWLASVVSQFVLSGQADCGVWPLLTWLTPVAV